MEITAVGGYEEVGRNMTAVKIGGDTIIIDMGIRLDRVLVHEDTDITKTKKEELVRMGVIPDDSVVRGNVRAIALTHGHLDHLGAVSKFVSKYNAPLIGTPYTVELAKRGIRADGGRYTNPVYAVEEGEILQVTPEISLEFIRATHSIPQTVILAVHSPHGTLVYANDFKFDDSPIIGEKTDYTRLKELGREGVKCLIVETVRVSEEGRTPSEKIAQKILEDSVARSDPEKGLIVTTFSSHIARISSITNAARIAGRTPILLGRSMEKFVGLAENMKILELPEDAHLYGSPESVKKILHSIVRDGKEKYLLVVTGHQGEPDALLTKIANKKFGYVIEKGEEVIFSADIIPNPMNVANRYVLETKLKLQGARLFKGAHVSGHASREDHHDLLRMLQPENVIPCHGDLAMLSSYAELAENLGYELNKNIRLVRNGQRVAV
ncbi:MAG: RNase J family beta-CASP ribonuclease [Euryarchaeota archaeon]|nr:RNase J family beta-CASP ribonuclease [Euryarchaeota archaeon]